MVSANGIFKLVYRTRYFIKKIKKIIPTIYWSSYFVPVYEIVIPLF